MPNGPRRFWLLAGPNGVGKTTYAFRHIAAVSGSLDFINLDEIARGLSPLAPERAERDAARIALSRARAIIARGDAFSMETTMAGHVHLALMREAAVAGLSPSLLYFSVRSPEICLERVARRVAEGGHDVEETVVRRRFSRSHANLPAYCEAASLWRIYEASGPKPCLAAEGRGATISYLDDDCLAGASSLLAAAIAGFSRAPPA